MGNKKIKGKVTDTAVALLEAALSQSNAINEVLREITRAIHSSQSLDRLFESIHRPIL